MISGITIMFLCGSLEPGRDGVGDYTRCLAGELERQGHQTSIAALKDNYVCNEIMTWQNAEGVQVPVLRIPSQMQYKQRFKTLQDWINKLNPEWISLQFVPYAFHEKGLPFLFFNRLRTLTKHRNVHLMMHEMWVGKGRNAGLKQSLISALQRVTVMRMMQLMNPSIVHTHLPLYLSNTKRLGGYNVKALPLFSNIPVVERTHHRCGRNVFRVGLFSQLTIGEAVIAFLKALTEEVMRREMEIEILLIGGTKHCTQQSREILEILPAFKDRVRFTGHLSPADVSATLQSCSLGITSVPRHGLGKSGSVAAFLAHGIPVAAPNGKPGHNYVAAGFFSPTLCAAVVSEPCIDSLKRAHNAALKAREEVKVSLIARKFILDLHNISSRRLPKEECVV